MRKIAKIAIATNVILAMMFIVFNYLLWDYVQSFTNFKFVTFNLFEILAFPLSEYGYAISIDTSAMPNLPFWLFFVAIAVNLYFIYKLSKTPTMR
jgi:hypothetical protein